MDFEQKKANGIKVILTYVIIFYLLAAFIQIIISNIYVALGGDNIYVLQGLIQLIIYLILITPIGIIYKNEIKIDITSYKELCKKKNQSLFLPILIGFGIMYGANIFVNNLINNMNAYSEVIKLGFGPNNSLSLQSESDNQAYIVSILKNGGFIGILGMFCAAVFIGPVVEELVFRKAIFSLFKSDELALIISSFAFGMIHVVSSIGQYNLVSIIIMSIPYIVSGLAFGYVYKKYSRNILISTAVHVISNFISIVSILAMK